MGKIVLKIERRDCVLSTLREDGQEIGSSPRVGELADNMTERAKSTAEIINRGGGVASVERVSETETHIDYVFSAAD